MAKDHIYIGCSGFYNNDWKGSLYPVDAKSKDFLTLYSQQFNSVEINTTFYRKPTPKTLERWFNETNDDFKFYIKIPKSISHDKRLENCEQEITEFCTYIEVHLKEKLAGFLYQFPPSFKNTDEHLNMIIENVDTNFLNVIEFRHESWWTNEIFDALQEKNIVFSGVSFPGNLPEDVIINNPEILYYRLHGKPVLYKSEYSSEFLNSLAEKIIHAKKKSYVFFNNTWGTAAVKNGLFLKETLAK